VLFRSSQYVAVGSYGTILTSTDGLTWIARSTKTTNDIRCIVYGNYQYAALGGSGTILVSPAVNISVEKHRKNPVSNTLRAQFTAPNMLRLFLPAKLGSQFVTMSIYTISGKKLYSRSSMAFSNELSIIVSSLPASLYMVECVSNKLTCFAKFVVIK
jgi:hypothetical protein